MKHLQSVVATLLAVVLLLAVAGGAEAAPNTATFNIAGAARPDSNTINLNSASIAGLALVKGAYLTSDGTPIADGATLPTGTSVDFLIYVDNNTLATVLDVSVSDTLDGTFLYQGNSIRVYNATATGASAATILNDVKTLGAPMSDLVDGTDAAGISGVIVSAGDETGNATVNINPNTVWTMVFTVVLQ